VAVASAGPYASLHFAPDRQPRQHPTTLFLQAGCPSCRPTNSIKALKALALNAFWYGVPVAFLLLQRYLAVGLLSAAGPGAAGGGASVPCAVDSAAWSCSRPVRSDVRQGARGVALSASRRADALRNHRQGAGQPASTDPLLQASTGQSPSPLFHLATAAVAGDSSHMTASSSASWSRFSPPSNIVNGHVSTMWFMVCRWPQSQEGDWARPHLCKLARHGP